MILKQVIRDAPTNSVEATWVDAGGKQVKCQSYADVQMGALEGDLGADLPAYSALIASVRAAIVPYVAPIPTLAACLLQIDRDTDAIYGAMLGNRSEEYNLAATEAKAYKDAAYTGTVPGSVQSWATAKAWTTTQSADDILATATQWRGAQSAIRAARLLRKEQVRVTTSDPAARATAMAAWAGFTTLIRGQLGIA